MNALADLWIRLWGEALSEIRVECAISEDMAHRSVSFISPEMFRGTMSPPTKK